MRLRGVFREVVRDIRSGTARLSLLCLILTMLCGTLVITDVAAIRALLDEASAFRKAGGSTLTIAAPGRVDGESCSSLIAVDGVVAAGSIREKTSKLSAGALPNAPFATYEVSPGFAAILIGQPLQTSGLVLAEDIADELALTAGDTFATAGGLAAVAGVFPYPSDGRRGGLGWAVLIPMSDDQPFDECWVSAWPVDAGLSTLLALTLIPGADESGEAPQIGQLNAGHGRQFTGTERYALRPTVFAPFAAALLGLVLAVMAIRLRRIELASNLHAGVRTRDVHLTMLLEAAAWALPAALIASMIGVLATTGVENADRVPLLVSVLRITSAALAGATVGTVASTGLIRERQLFAYFKERS